jgi:hypothetical protein
MYQKATNSHRILLETQKGWDQKEDLNKRNYNMKSLWKQGEVVDVVDWVQLAQDRTGGKLVGRVMNINSMDWILVYKV